VIYSEGGGYWTYFEATINALIDEYSESVIYVTSSEDDPILNAPPVGVKSFYVGAGTIRTIFFATLDVDVLVTTMPDLQTFHIKRSPYHVKYVYLHHSMVSTHMVYRPAAFDHFDAILCVGPHHIEETKARECKMGLPPKDLVEHGYGRLDIILNESQRDPGSRKNNEPKCVLVAPTWGQSALLEKHGCEVIRYLLDAGLRVIVRPHPRTISMRPEVIAKIVKNFEAYQQFELDEDANARKSFYAADVMVSDWSGAALEFSFGLERPIIFVNLVRKIQNPSYLQLEIEPLEVKIRSEIGEVVSLNQLHRIGEIARELAEDSQRWEVAARSARNRWVFNARRSGTAAAKYLYSILP
jgi:YidC/Oxa1 family membrane protein insertase